MSPLLIHRRAFKFLTAIHCFVWLSPSSLPLLASAQNLTCTSDDLNAYIRCVQTSPCVCSNCDPDPLDGVPEIVIDVPPGSCQDVSRIFCPLIRCCSACETEAAAWYACNFQSFAYFWLKRDCPRTCPGYAYADVPLGNCQPTQAPTQTQPICQNEVGRYSNCVERNGDSDTCSADCSISFSEISNPSALRDTCGNQDVFCPVLRCCPDCERELESLAECVREERLGLDSNQQDDENCSPLVCPDEPPPTLAPAPVPTTPAIDPSPPTEPEPTAPVPEPSPQQPTGNLPPTTDSSDAEPSRRRNHSKSSHFVFVGMVPPILLKISWLLLL